MRNINIYDVVILGGGPGGIYASYLAKNKGLKPLLVEKTNILGGQPVHLYPQKEITDFPLFSKIKSFDFINRLVNQFNCEKIDKVINSTIEKVIFEKGKKWNFTCLLTKNRQIRTQNLLLAIGNGLFKPNLLAIPGAKNSNKIEYRFSDIKKYQNKNIVILGGGDSAVDFANTIATKSNTSVTILHRRDSFRASGSNVKLLNKNGVRIILNSVCLKISRNFLFYKNVKNNKIDKIYFDKILVQYGQNPSTCLPNWMSKLKLTENKKILVNIKQETSIKNIYAIGNMTFFENKPYMLINTFGEASTAINQILIKKKQYV